MNPHIEHRVRERAYRIWLDEGMPEGRADLHWEMASELVAGETAAPAAKKPRRAAAAPKSAAPAAKKSAKPASAPAAKRTRASAS